MRINWTETMIEKLLSCKTDEELIKEFPGYKMESLRRSQRNFKINKNQTIKPIEKQVEEDKLKNYWQAKIRILEQKNKELLKGANLRDRILEQNKNTLESLPVVDVPARPKIDKNKTIESAVLVGSCWHIGEVINKQQMGSLNEYNFDIFIKRLQFLVEKTISFTMDNMSKHTFEELHVLLTGDMVSGIIHDELRETNELNIVEQVHLGAFVTAQAMLDFARVFPKVIITGVVGNHGRTQHEKQFKNKGQVNWDYIFYNDLALLLRDQKNIHFNIPLSFWAGVEIQGYNFLIQHGDTMKSWGGIPFYGMNREYSKWMEIHASQGKFFQYFIASHFHTKAVMQSPAGEKILNSSLKGGDEYAAGLGLFGDPIQMLFGVHKKYGKTWELSLNAKHANELIAKSRYTYDKTKPIGLQEL